LYSVQWIDILITDSWPVFDAGQSVVWRMDPNGQPGYSGGGYAEVFARTLAQTYFFSLRISFSYALIPGEVDAAMAAWNSDPDTNINYVRSGTTTNIGGLQTADGVNAIIFNDQAPLYASVFHSDYLRDFGTVQRYSWLL
jgi:hypothetical protein